jgi:pimeloyl-ACP methyl ester carboxylesterase
MAKGMGAPAIVVALMRLLPIWRKLVATAHTLPYDWAVLGDMMTGEPLTPDDWASVRQPTCVIAGEKSPQQLRRAAEALAAVLPQSEHRILEGQSHNVSMKALAPMLLEFFSRRDESTSARAASA